MKLTTCKFSLQRVPQVVITFLMERNIRMKNQIEDMEWYQKVMLSNLGTEGISLGTVSTGLNETGLPFDVVPNIVHYILFTIHEIEFSHFISMLSVLKNQRPELIYIHCDCHQLGRVLSEGSSCGQQN